jgi:putative addiction module component (TIGR02574 family)
MSLADVEQIAFKLSEVDRALLAAALLDSVAPDSLDQADDEFERRESEIEQGTISEISHEELLKRVNAERRR